MNQENEKKENVQIEGKENQPVQKRSGVNYYNPFFSFFNDCFRDDEIGDMMRTDITESTDAYFLEVELPGVDKKDVKISLDKGYLTISARLNTNDYRHNGKFIHKERISGTFKRSFYAGDAVTKADISAQMENGVLAITVKKPAEKSDSEKYISID